jgi:hypothetical protein
VRVCIDVFVRVGAFRFVCTSLLCALCVSLHAYPCVCVCVCVLVSACVSRGECSRVAQQEGVSINLFPVGGEGLIKLLQEVV